MKLTFCVRGQVQPWARTRLAFDGLGRVRPVNTTVLRDYEHQVASAAALAARAQGWRCEKGQPVTLEVAAYFPIAASLSARKCALLLGMPHVQRPDGDNVVKAILDGVQKAGVIYDDAQVADLNVSKRWCEAGQERVEVTLEVEA